MWTLVQNGFNLFLILFVSRISWSVILRKCLSTNDENGWKNLKDNMPYNRDLNNFRAKFNVVKK